MARMLQALKNLEAKSPAKAAPKAKAPAPTPAIVPEPARPMVARSVESPIGPSIAATVPQVTESIDTLAGHLASLEIAIGDPAGRFELGRLSATSTVPAAPKPAANWFIKPAEPLASSSRTICEIERQIRRTLSDPVRAKSLTELASRLRQDMQQTAAKTVAFTGIGQSATHEALLYVSTLLAEQGDGKVLLVDGDLNRRALTDALEYGRDRGLGELLEDAISPQDVCQPTAAEKLTFLPAGLLQRLNSAAGERWAKHLQQLTVEFNCVLIDAGRASDSAASTLARIADATYLVVQLGTVETSEAQKGLADFRAAGARVLGCIAT
jgi:Mrp family chromosome partitioning ATPase